MLAHPTYRAIPLWSVTPRSSCSRPVSYDSGLLSRRRATARGDAEAVAGRRTAEPGVAGAPPDASSAAARAAECGGVMATDAAALAALVGVAEVDVVDVTAAVDVAVVDGDFATAVAVLAPRTGVDGAERLAAALEPALAPEGSALALRVLLVGVRDGERETLALALEPSSVVAAAAAEAAAALRLGERERDRERERVRELEPEAPAAAAGWALRVASALALLLLDSVASRVGTAGGENIGGRVDGPARAELPVPAALAAPLLLFIGEAKVEGVLAGRTGECCKRSYMRSKMLPPGAMAQPGRRRGDAGTGRAFGRSGDFMGTFIGEDNSCVGGM